MNITEAHQLNTLLTYLVTPHGSEAAAAAAAVTLAGRAYAALGAGLSGDDICELWGRHKQVLPVRHRRARSLPVTREQ